MKILDGRELASFIKERHSITVRALEKKPKLLIIRDSDNPVILKYVSYKIKYGEDVNIKVEDFKAENSKEIAEKIKSANNDEEITGIIIQLPIVEKEKTEELCNLISPKKDVDGLGENAKFDSATATAINWLLAGYDIDLKNQKLAIVGRGKLVGAPLYKMWKNSNLDVTLFHRGDDLTNLKHFDIIVTATGVPGLIKANYIKPGAVLVDAGTASESNKITGDVAPEVRDRKDLTALTPALGGVGPLTITCLFDHLLQATNQSKNQSSN